MEIDSESLTKMFLTQCCVRRSNLLIKFLAWKTPANSIHLRIQEFSKLKKIKSLFPEPRMTLNNLSAKTPEKIFDVHYKQYVAPKGVKKKLAQNLDWTSTQALHWLTINKRIDSKGHPVYDRDTLKVVRDSLNDPIHARITDSSVERIERIWDDYESGITGCGKSTRVPAMILRACGVDAAVMVSEPRRVAAIGLAERVASEMGEEVGYSIGYQVRLNSRPPRPLAGAVLFCTSGVLLNRLQTNPGLTGCTHVIIDEAHERDVNTDITLLLLKRALELNTELRVIIMSATLDTAVLSTADQSKMFGTPPPGVRKLVLATNVAETSVTIPDVVYVIDSGAHKENTIREGTGHCYRLYTKEKEAEFDAHTTPEILRVPLEQTVLDCKSYAPDDKAQDFLSQLPEPPIHASTVGTAVAMSNIIAHSDIEVFFNAADRRDGDVAHIASESVNHAITKRSKSCLLAHAGGRHSAERRALLVYRSSAVTAHVPLLFCRGDVHKKNSNLDYEEYSTVSRFKIRLIKAIGRILVEGQRECFEGKSVDEDIR
ncbi:putative ATP-dependent RNA helicase DHX30 [Operophtera brumata]|uniref:Putative ATP-dependent RNA helicase DHX30 n=1 Tax=Operophtera brumata TaxID=104452 RepID=A0A0L7LHN4_OPEBR|nr:putative ATP-dependent RNA helicase DHX30 [Operophtera brumata]